MTHSHRPRGAAKLSTSLHSRLDSYAMAAAAAGVGIVSLAQPAHAKIVYTPVHKPILQGQLPVYADLNHDGTDDFQFFVAISTRGSSFSTSLGVGPVNSNGDKMVGQKPSASALRAGARIGPGRRFSTQAHTMAHWYFRHVVTTYTGFTGQWANGGKGVKNRYVGLKFILKGKVHFGWARVNVSFAMEQHPTIVATLTGYAYETIPNKPIIAGNTKNPDDSSSEASNTSLTAPVPEAPALGMLALGAPALSIWRREELITVQPEQ